MSSNVNDAPSEQNLVLFVCLHGSAKGLIAAEYFNRMAQDRGADLRRDLPLVSDGLEIARDAIVLRVERLLDRLTAG